MDLKCAFCHINTGGIEFQRALIQTKRATSTALSPDVTVPSCLPPSRVMTIEELYTEDSTVSATLLSALGQSYASLEH
jgi:hypothetical protein